MNHRELKERAEMQARNFKKMIEYSKMKNALVFFIDENGIAGLFKGGQGMSFVIETIYKAIKESLDEQAAKDGSVICFGHGEVNTNGDLEINIVNPTDN